MSNTFKRLILFLAFIAFVMGTFFATVSHESVEARMHHSPCWHCSGTGRCPACDGEGTIVDNQDPVKENDYFGENRITCRECYGDGFCNACHGSGLEE